MLLVIDYLLSIVLVAYNISDNFVVELKRFDWGFYSVGSPIYDVFTGSMLVNFAAAVCISLRDYQVTSDPRVRLQLRLWMVGAVVALPLGITNFLPVYGIPVYPLGHLGNALWAGIVAYAIVRHRLMDIDVVFTKAASYLLVASCLVAPPFFASLWLQKQSFGQAHPDLSVFFLVALLGVGILFPTLMSRAEERLERSFFRAAHEQRSSLRDFAKSIVRILDRDQLVADLVATLKRTLQPGSIVVALVDNDRGVISVRAAVGPMPRETDLAPGHPLLGCLEARQGSVLLGELEASPDQAERLIIADLFRHNGWSLCIPLKIGSRVIGFIALGPKPNVGMFSAVDLDLLETLGAEASVAIENARLYEKLRESQEIIRRADRLSALGILAAGIAHEVRNPLVSIQTFFQLAPERRHDEEFFHSFLPMAAGEVKRITNLINELLSFARSPAPELAPVDLGELVDKVATLLDPEARKHKLALKVVSPSPSPVVLGDADRIKQVLLNLVLNAIQASPQGEVVLIRTRWATHGGALCGRVEVEDRGPGISKEQMENIFVPFFTTKASGTGLGLAIAHQIVREHGGVIDVRSKRDGGTCFLVDLPLLDDNKSEPSQSPTVESGGFTVRPEEKQGARS
jgi:signal transduction histidine kinase